MKKAILIVGGVLVGVIVIVYIVGLLTTKEIRTEISINSDADSVWSHLIGFKQYSEWNPFIKKISGELTEGAQINATMQLPGGDPMDLEPTLLVVKNGQELRWKGKLLMPGIFDGEHYFQIEEISNKKVRFVQGEKFAGILALLLWGMLEPGTIQGFQEMNEALKHRVEANAQLTLK